MKAKKSLGQHFLKSEKALAQIIDTAQIAPTDIVLEIGPGMGILTEKLLAKAGKVIAIEKDRDMIAILEERFALYKEQGKLELQEADILAFDPSILPRGYKLVANIPYYITGAIIEQFLDTTNQPESMVLLMQKEVAERIIARDGKESVLSIAVKAYGVPKYIAKVPAGAFNPPPKVDSAILYIEHISRDFFGGIDEKAFFDLLKSLFGKKRKQLGGSLGEYLNDKESAQHILNELAIDTRTRPEDINLETWKKLSALVEEYHKK